MVGSGFTVTHSDVGKYLVTLSETPPYMIHISTELHVTSDDHDYAVDTGDIDAGAGTFFIYTRSAGSDTDLTNTVECSFLVVAANTSEVTVV